MKNKIKNVLLTIILEAIVRAYMILFIGAFLIVPGVLGYCIDVSYVWLYAVTVPSLFSCIGVYSALCLGRDLNDE